MVWVDLLSERMPGAGLLCFRDGALTASAPLDLFGGPDDIYEELVDAWLRQQHALIVPGMPAEKAGPQPGMDSSEGEDAEASCCNQPIEIAALGPVHAITEGQGATAAGR